MRVGVKQPFFEDRLQHQLYQGVDHPRHPFRVQPGVEIHTFTGRVLHREHFSSRILHNDIRNPEVGDIRESGAKEHYGARFATKVGFPVQTAGKLMHHNREVQCA